MRRDGRRVVEDKFRNNPDTLILIATDAAGEGINLQRARLMVKYDLPWNPNRLEQRFGRVHCIGQTKVCHLWNLVAGQTREGSVYQQLMGKLEAERNVLSGQVFDVLGKLFQDTPLRKMLIEAIRYGDDPEVRARLQRAVEDIVDHERVRNLLEKRSLVTTAMDTSQIMRIHENMERAAARRLQPHYIKSFFLQAFEHLGGTAHERENGRLVINNVPAAILNWAKDHGLGSVFTKYERICFEKALINLSDKPPAAFICPGHALLDATIGLLLERDRDALKHGAILVDETDPSTEPRVLFCLEQAIQGATLTRSEERRIISHEVHFVEIDIDGNVREAGGAPYLDYRPATADEGGAVQYLLEQDWLRGEALERKATAHAVESQVPRHLDRIRQRRIELIDKTEAAVQKRLTQEINFWDKRASELRAQEQAGRTNARLNSACAQERADRLADRLKQCKDQLAQERQISASPPVVIGGALIIPIGLLLGEQTPPEILDRRIAEQIAMKTVMEAEIALGNDPKDVSAQKVVTTLKAATGRPGESALLRSKGGALALIQ